MSYQPLPHDNERPPTYSQQHAAQPRKSRKGLWIGLAIGGVVLIMLTCLGACALFAKGADEVGNQIEREKQAKAASVQITKCKKNVIGGMDIEFSVKNDTDKPQSYWLQFEVINKAGERVGEAHGILNDVGPGVTAKSQTVTLEDVGNTDGATCRLVDVT